MSTRAISFRDLALLISDPSDETPGGIYAYDGSSVEVIDRISTTGIALAPDGRLLRVLRSLDEPGSCGEALTYDDRGVVEYRRLDGVADGHGATWHGTGFVVASTGTNSVVRLDHVARTIVAWSADCAGDAWHVNDLLSHGDTLYATAFGRFDGHRRWVGAMAGAGIVFAIPDGKTVVNGLTAPHNPRRIGDAWLICNSGGRELVAVDGDTQKVEQRLPLRRWPRGLAVARGIAFVGESSHRFDNADPPARATASVVDLAAWRVVDRIEVPGREIYDLALAPRALVDRLASGFRTNPTRTRMTTQLQMFEDVGVQPTRLWAVAEPLPPQDQRARIDVQLPARLPENATVEIEATIENLGGCILVSSPPNPVFVTYRWYRADTPAHIVEDPL